MATRAPTSEEVLHFAHNIATIHVAMLYDMTPLQLEELIADLDQRYSTIRQKTPQTPVTSSYLVMNKMLSDRCKVVLERKRLSA